MAVTDTSIAVLEPALDGTGLVGLSYHFRAPVNPGSSECRRVMNRNMVNAHLHDSVCDETSCQKVRGIEQSNCLINQLLSQLLWKVAKRRPHAAFGKTTQNRALVWT